MISPKVAVVILNFNGKKFLEKFLPNVIANSVGHQIYVADNGSTDDSIDYFETYSHSDVMITDYSGTGLTFAWGFNKKAIFYTSEQNNVFGEDIYFVQNTTELEQVLKSTLIIQKENISGTTKNSIFNRGSSSEVFLNYLNFIKLGIFDSDWISLP